MTSDSAAPPRRHDQWRSRNRTVNRAAGGHVSLSGDGGGQCARKESSVSTPTEPGQPPKRPVPEPTHIVRRRRTEALAELVRELREGESRAPEPVHEPVVVHVAPPTAEDATQQLPSVGGRVASDDGLTLRRAAVVVGVTAAALIGFGAALLLPGPQNGGAPRQQAAMPPSAPATASDRQRGTDPDGPGTLREGDSGPDVTELQKRLSRIPDVYAHGAIDGRYDAALTAAVARFQLWYGIRGDETGVYGNDTRRDLETRTTL